METNGTTAYTVYASEEEMAATAAAAPSPHVPLTTEQFSSDADCALAAMQAVNEILENLADMGAGEAADDTEEEEQQQQSCPEEPRLYPIFYKSGQQTQSSPATTCNTRAQTGTG